MEIQELQNVFTKKKQTIKKLKRKNLSIKYRFCTSPGVPLMLATYNLYRTLTMEIHGTKIQSNSNTYKLTINNGEISHPSQARFYKIFRKRIHISKAHITSNQGPKMHQTKD